MKHALSSTQWLIRYLVLSIEEVLPLLDTSTHSMKKIRAELKGFQVKTCTLRLRTFRRKGTSCAHCELHATHFAIEESPLEKSPHLNLYAATEKGEMLFTCDHIIPLSKGGKNSCSNTQTLCYDCNQKKADKLETEL